MNHSYIISSAACADVSRRVPNEFDPNHVFGSYADKVQTPRRTASRGERTLITIHGIRTDGLWQGRLEAVFDSHFHYESFKYPQFQHSVGAVLFVALESFALVFAIGLLAVAWRVGWLAASPAYWACAGLLAASSLLIASLIADRRRDEVVTDFINFVSSANWFGLPPHIVAHSLGSFVLARALLRYSEFRTGKVVLLGCVLQSELDWGGIREQFQVIRNELGARDWVAAIASVLSPFVKEMGSAGKAGFRKPQGAVVNLRQNDAGGPWRSCACGSCRIVPAAAVLNIQGQDIGHNDLSAVTIRALRRWLPYFWDIPPDYFERFVDLCLECDEMEENGDPQLEANVDRLLAGCWYWTQGTLSQFLHGYLNPLTGHPDEQCIRSVAKNIFRTIAKANLATDRAGQKFLFPLQAVQFSAKRTLRAGS